MRSIPATLRALLLEDLDRDLLDHPDPDLVVAETTEQIVEVLRDNSPTRRLSSRWEGSNTCTRC